MQLYLVAIGSPKYSFYEQASAHYLEQIRHHWKLEVIELREASGGNSEKESELVLATLEKRKWREDGRIKKILLEEKGQSHLSVDWAKKWQKWQTEGTSSIVFILGGAYGFTPEFKKEFPEKLALSAFTFPHDLARLVLLEQIYRVQMIMAGKKYHHA